jgi:hypothetical protein
MIYMADRQRTLLPARSIENYGEELRDPSRVQPQYPLGSAKRGTRRSTSPTDRILLLGPVRIIIIIIICAREK